MWIRCYWEGNVGCDAICHIRCFRFFFCWFVGAVVSILVFFIVSCLSLSVKLKSLHSRLYTFVKVTSSVILLDAWWHPSFQYKKFLLLRYEAFKCFIRKADSTGLTQFLRYLLESTQTWLHWPVGVERRKWKARFYVMDRIQHRKQTKPTKSKRLSVVRLMNWIDFD